MPEKTSRKGALKNEPRQAPWFSVSIINGAVRKLTLQDIAYKHSQHIAA